ncbi:pirin family protein [Rhodospirillum rubrum]|uniref:Pirin-like n=1 Tax=Rhodospirillum rubrum (strain ATCC 11170 / ATH 1.1.1 / DSM 467 / LMG 4362 / NCIMB 8255 / S1) TaxID=269796 RepID=Q2RXG5_RHORT|nr:pirin family protein [Rhodospirillum rubrum]ABC21180.1 Pirin-like [Rhodospirillum rubrum ATCC 11170]AEO46853.1 Pirin-like protein [Rhodospirillum rubrum F11]MBK5952727.1 pirin family protein [Rhodospirillum rubrum]QXG80870.1 pirin family protein [Rhodospirillum rubrum]HAQ00439.1 pirin family protein [Rhodospirillum rubrum]
MIELRPFASLGTLDIDWLTARYHFSFSRYYDPARMGLGSLRVWNDDQVRAGTGFEPHSHRDMEIITYVRKGAITHEDNLGNKGRTAAGDVQVMWAGSGITHAEYNRESEDTLLFQIWIETARPGIAPGWEARAFPKEPGQVIALASGRDLPDHAGALPLHQDAAILGGVLTPGQTLTLPSKGRKLYIVPTTGALRVGDHTARARDGVAIWDEAEITLTALEETEVVIADVA